MEAHFKNRPAKTIFEKTEIERLRNLAIEKIKTLLLSNDKILKIILIGSSIKNSFGSYEEPGFRGSLFSDFDFIIFTENDYIIPDWLQKEPDGKPFPDDKINLAYRQKKFIENKYDAEIFFLHQATVEDPVLQEQGELAGIPMTDNTNHKYFIVYKK